MKLIIAEKPSVSENIKDVLKDPSYKFISVSGHIYKIDYSSSKDLSWSKVDLRDLVMEPYAYIYDKTLSLKELSKIKKGQIIEQLILALDPDIEGYNIQNAIVNYLTKQGVILNKIQVVCLESLSTEGVRKAFSEKLPYDCTKGYPGELRMKLDFLFGTVLTRKASFDFLKETRRWSTYNTGRVQTPTLKEVIEREQSIKNFKPEKYYLLKALKEETNLDHDIILKRYEELVEQDKQKVKEVISLEYLKTSKKIVLPKKGLNTDELLRLLSKDHAMFSRITPAVTNLLSNMYLKGMISYPRVENSQYNNYPDLLQTFGENFKKYYSKEPLYPILKPSKTVTDHGPVTPLVLPDPKVHEDREIKVLESLYKYGKSIFSGSNDYLIYQYVLKTSTEYHNFEILVEEKVNYEDGNPYNKKIDPLSLKLNTLELQSKETKPKGYFTTATLIKQMTRKKLGTKSTKTKIIQNLVDNKYLYYDRTFLRSTERGKNLIRYWEKNFKTIVDYKLTAEIESCFSLLKNESTLLEKENYYRTYIKDNLFPSNIV